MHPTVFCLLPTGGMKHATPRHTHTGHRSVEHAWHFPACFSFQILRASPPLNLFFFFSLLRFFFLFSFFSTRGSNVSITDDGWIGGAFESQPEMRKFRGEDKFFYTPCIFFIAIFSTQQVVILRVPGDGKQVFPFFFLSLFFSNGRILENKETRALCIPVFSFYLARNNSLFYSNISTRSSAILIKRAV